MATRTTNDAPNTNRRRRPVADTSDSKPARNTTKPAGTRVRASTAKAKPASSKPARSTSTRITIEIGWDAKQRADLAKVLKVEDFDALLYHYFRQSLMWSSPVGSAIELLKVEVK